MKYLFSILFIGILFANCNDDNDAQFNFNEQLAIDEEIIENYLTENNLTAEIGNSGLRYIIEDPGTGSTNPTAFSEVIVKYKGYFPNGEVFDESEGLKFELAGTISGWRLGIPLYKKGGKGKLFIPSSLGYGAFPPAGIPANQVLIFDIELLNFN